MKNIGININYSVNQQSLNNFKKSIETIKNSLHSKDVKNLHLYC